MVELKVIKEKKKKRARWADDYVSRQVERFEKEARNIGWSIKQVEQMSKVMAAVYQMRMT